MLAEKIANKEGFLRFLEITLGIISLNLLLFPLWGSFIVPELVAYLVLTFDVLWLYKSATSAYTALKSHQNIERSKVTDWLALARNVDHFDDTHHIIIIPNANEPLGTIRRILLSIANQDFPKERLFPVLAMENLQGNIEKAETLIAEFKPTLPKITYTLHTLTPGEVRGKSSNESFSIRVLSEKIEGMGINPDYLTVTTADVDAVFHHKHFSYLSHAFLTNPNRYRRFWQGALVFYNNILKIPAPARIITTINTVWQIAQLSRRDRMVNISTYSLSYKMLKEVGFWDVDVIPEDYRIFFKCYFRLGGTVEVEPLFLPVSLDAAESTGVLRTLKNQYLQQQRWAWGISDDPVIIKWWLLTREIPFWERTIRVLKVLMDHIFWPLNWLLITVGANIPIFVNPRFSQTILGQQLPRISSLILTLCLVFLGVMLYIDEKQRPKSQKATLPTKIMRLLEWPMMPIAGLFLGAIPGLDAHLRLLFGKYLEYRVTEKVE